jgi:hypothetical protein
MMTGALVGRVKGPSCQLDEVSLVAAKRAMLRSVADRKGNLLVGIGLPVSFIMSDSVILRIACRLWIATIEDCGRPSDDAHTSESMYGNSAGFLRFFAWIVIHEEMGHGNLFRRSACVEPGE